jgi:D-aminopeptidase
MKKLCLLPIAILYLAPAVFAVAAEPRARDLGIPFDGTPGTYNAITDVAGVTVGHETLIRDLENDGAARTGVTAVLPRGTDTLSEPVFGAWFSLNGNGEMTGTTWIEESGFVEGPIMITNTHSVGAVHEATIQWRVMQGDPDDSGFWWSLPVIAETWDGYLNDINGFHVRAEHAHRALEAAAGGPVAEGAVGGGTGMICHDFKCGIGTSSRLAEVGDSRYTVGVLVQANYGSRRLLRVAGVPVGRMMQEDQVYSAMQADFSGFGSIIIVVATDAPLLPQQLKRLARRAALGLARNGSIASNGSGDIFVAFSTAEAEASDLLQVQALPNGQMNPLFIATVDATEEAIINALVAGRDMTGHKGRSVKAIDHGRLQEILRQHNRLLD